MRLEEAVQFEANGCPFVGVFQALFNFDQQVFYVVVDSQVGVTGNSEGRYF